MRVGRWQETVRSDTTSRMRTRCLAGTIPSLTVLFFLAQLANAQAGPKVYRDTVEPHWSADKTRFWYRNDLPRGEREFILVDAAKGSRTPAFDHQKVARGLAKLESRKIDAGRLPVDELEFA